MRPLRAVIADGGLTPRADLLLFAERAGFQVVGEAPDWVSVAEMVSAKTADLVLVSGDPDFARGLSGVNGSLATVLVIPDARSAKEYAESGAFVVLTPDVEDEMISALAQMAVARASDLRAAKREVQDLRSMLETRKLVERAKGVLMRRLGIAEDAAYRKMQKASQDENRKMAEIADSILSAERLYGDDAEKDDAR
jgi:two-component system, response regulator PdtaR